VIGPLARAKEGGEPQPHFAFSDSITKRFLLQAL